MLWGFSSYLPSRDKHQAHCTTQTILAPPEKATAQILCSQGYGILSLLLGCAEDVSALNTFFHPNLLYKKCFLPAEILRKLIYSTTVQKM